jgi:serine/threonine protein kinase
MAPDSILSDDEQNSMQSMLTQWGGDSAALGRIDHYDILRKLGGGGFGVVYLAKDTASGVEVAIKTLHPLLKHNAEEMESLREKFRLVSRLSHPNIATALVLHPCRDISIRDDAARRELKLSPGDSVMVMRYAPGATLSKWRRQFPDGIAPFDLALEVGRQVAAALDYAHGERIVHRDIKPGNIMVETLEGGGLRARILDFGLAAEIRSSMSRVSTEQGDTSGTRPYMAPEQWLGRKQDGRTDQYALACVLYELLSGAPPFAGVFETGDPMIMMATVKGELPEEIEDLDPVANAAILRGLAKTPKDRYLSCSAFVAGLSTTEIAETDGAGENGKNGGAAARHLRNPMRSDNVCPSCSLRNPNDARYCEGCGEPLYRPCPECGKESASRIRFCSGCGTDIDGFSACKQLSDTIESAVQTRDWTTIVKGVEAVPAGVRLPGPVGKRLLSALSGHLEKAKESLARSQELDRVAQTAIQSGDFEKAVSSAMESQKLFPGCAADSTFVKRAERYSELEKALVAAAKREKPETIRGILADMASEGMPERPLAAFRTRAEEWLLVFDLYSRTMGQFSLGNWKAVEALATEIPSDNGFVWEYSRKLFGAIRTLQSNALANRIAAEKKAADENVSNELKQLASAGEFSQAFKRVSSIVANKLPGFDVAKLRLNLLYNANELNSKYLDALQRQDWYGARQVLVQLHEQHGLSDETLQKRMNSISENLERLRRSEVPPGSEKTIVFPKFVMRFCWCPATTDYGWRLPNDGKDYFTRTILKLSSRDVTSKIRLTKGFWMSKTPVTQAQWQAVMETTPSFFKEGKRFGIGGDPLLENPVESVSWNDCQDFINRLGLLAKDFSGVFRLPTEAEWEYACRAGGNGPYGLLKNGREGTPEQLGWFLENSNSTTHPVGQKLENKWGLQDMIGNVREWCCDGFDALPRGLVVDPMLNMGQDSRVCRGGSYLDSVSELKVRKGARKDGTYPEIGFRVVFAAPPEAKSAP